ncbi:MAG: glycoside hydrolase family 20 zincin-like fold domain-containing protein [Armatimonadota bacterium]|nr:beta-N-acetylhexosaminidase [Armatimonadota bacterium]MDW8026081.1 glycoside hydrolase family 20 zincin-like fold domain-containing protein [Armatimonadota bacterium]
MRFEMTLFWAIALAFFILTGTGYWFASREWNIRQRKQDKSEIKFANASFLTTKQMSANPVTSQSDETLPLIFPPPRNLQRLPDWILKLPIKVEAPKELEAPAELLKRELIQMFGAEAIALIEGTEATVISLELDNLNLRREEEYTVETGAKKVVLRARDFQGAFWAIHSFLQLLSHPTVKRTSNGWRIAGVKVHDYPQSNFRAFMIQGAWAPSIEAYKMTIELLARLKVRYVAVEFGPQVVLDFDPTIARYARFSKSEAKSVIDYARSLGLEPIGYLNLLAHLERAYDKQPYTQHGGIMIQNDEVYEQFVFPILTEMLEIYGPVKWFHCGMDEAWELFEWLSKQGYDSAQLLAKHIAKINEFLKRRGVKMVIWHDMFFSPDLEKEIGAPIGPANGGPPQNTARAIDLIPKDVVLNYWFYEPLEAYPALDWLRRKGFEVWASPWQTPFSLVRYAQARNIPTMGTIWSDPPRCFGSRSLAPVIALYAWASWTNVGANEIRPKERIPERKISEQAIRVVQSILWRRRSLFFPSQIALIINPKERRIAYKLLMPNEVDRAKEQYFGIPFDFSAPFRLPTLKGLQKPFEGLEEAVFVLMPDGRKLKIDGVNKVRGEDELILYASPRKSTGTNIYGAEVAISSTGEVIEVADYGSGNMAIPKGGIVLSAHAGRRGANFRALLGLKVGDRVGILDKDGNLIGGYGGLVFKLRLPNGELLTIDGIDKSRGDDELVLYKPSFGEGKTGTNQWGIEVIVADGKVVEVRNLVGNAPIPPNGYVLSAHWGKTSAKAKALSSLKIGDAVSILVSTQEGDMPIEQWLKSAVWETDLNATCKAIFFVIATRSPTARGKKLGSFIVEYADGSQVAIPIRYGMEALSLGYDELPQEPHGKNWLIFASTFGAIASEWENEKPDLPVFRLRFLPAIQAADLGLQILAVTASGT